jgi:hypothetical protein
MPEMRVPAPPHDLDETTSEGAIAEARLSELRQGNQVSRKGFFNGGLSHVAIGKQDFAGSER